MFGRAKIALLLLSLLMPCAVWAKDDRQVIFDETIYHLANVREGVSKSINEYIPAGQKLDNWLKMFALHVYHDQKDTTPQEFAAGLGQLVSKLNPGTPYEIIYNAEKDEAIIDFLTWNNEEPFITEFNVFKFKKKDGDIVAMQYAYRSYGRFTEAFAKMIEDHRPLRIHIMAKTPFPAFVTEAEFRR